MSGARGEWFDIRSTQPVGNYSASRQDGDPDGSPTTSD
jgi:hypothetical protein